MYSQEIEEYIKLRNNLLTIIEYCEIIKTSPQIDHVIFQDEQFKLFTTDGYQFKLKIKEARSKS